MECLQSHLSTRNTTCPKCHQVFPNDVLNLHPNTAVASTVIPQAQIIPPQAIHVQQQFQQAPPPPPPPCQRYGTSYEASNLEELKEMQGEEFVSEWTPPPPSKDVSQDREVEVLIESSPELPQCHLAGVTNFNSVISVSASSQSTAVIDDVASPPMDIICILDVSGSMGSYGKLDNLKLAVNFMRDELKENDRMSVITFEQHATRIHGLVKMTQDNKSRTESSINRLRPGGGTRILSGMNEAHQILGSRQTKNPVSSVFLLTDGIDSSDLRQKKIIAKEIKEMGASLFVYGFGNDHDSQHLKAIADAGEGTFTFIERSDMVIDAFGGALGAEKSIFAQNLCLSLTTSNGSRITNIHCGNYRKSIDPSGTSAKIYYPNLMLGEQRDVLMVMELPAVSEPKDNQVICKTTLEYSPIASTDGNVTLVGQDCVISRVETVDKTLERNINVDVQVNRALLDSATTTSLAMADRGDYVLARKNLDDALTQIKSSTSCQRQDQKAVAFVTELESTMESFRDEDTYHRRGGRSMMSEMATNISHQRCTYAKEGRSKAYQNAASDHVQMYTNAKKMKFFGK